MEEIRNNNAIINRNNVHIIGNNNVIRGHGCKITGNNNVIHGNHLLIRGNNNVINGNIEELQGDNNVINGSCPKIRGNHNVSNGISSGVSTGASDISIGSSMVSTSGFPFSGVVNNYMFGDGMCIGGSNYVFDDISSIGSSMIVNNPIISGNAQFSGGNIFCGATSKDPQEPRECRSPRGPRGPRSATSYDTRSISSSSSGVSYFADSKKLTSPEISKTKNVVPSVPKAIENEESAKDGEAVCKICLDRAVKTVNRKCGHACLCVTCARKLADEPKLICPICRSELKRIELIYIDHN